MLPTPLPGMQGGKPPQTPAAQSIQIPGITDAFYANLLQNNPLYLQQKANLEAAGVAAGSARTQAIQSLLSSFGHVPAGFTDPYGDVTDLVRGLADKATQAGVSTYAQLGKARTDADQSVINDMAARGILSSGETGYQLGRNQQAYLTSLSEAEKEMLAQLQAAASGYAQTAADLAGQQGEAAQVAMDQILATHPIGPDDTAELLRRTIGRSGQGWYGLGDQLYRADGTLIDQEAARARLRARVRAMRSRGITGDRLRNRAAYRRLRLLRGMAQ